ncbi:hypothetical protein EDD18DRAFT_1460045 [Armillaria luteobubalina]|uniref:Uncharacterized protein n=1 Tax=Armillaria luteobubalina TaxID=153913 RepID=A0AA39QEA6_9AGAR|nr:hypothetical protein EDD18DRAFT_1460045 [Armillaria luteobubalina]
MCDGFVRIQRRPSIMHAQVGALQDITDKANLWQEVPEMLAMGLIDMFFFHLYKEPLTDFSRATYEKPPAADPAFMLLLSLSKTSKLTLHGGDPYEQQILDGWPGAFKWSVHLAAGCV